MRTAEIRMTENVGDSGLRFKIWFRRWKSQNTYILQASSAEAKTTWTDMIRKILWRQALRNIELRMQEVVCMGMGNKLFVDIKPSDAARSDQAADYITKDTGEAPWPSLSPCLPTQTQAPRVRWALWASRRVDESQTQMSTAVPAPGGQAAPFKRPHSTISESSTSSSSSQPSTWGPWRLHGPGCPAHVGPLSPAHCHWPCDIPTCIEEDEQEQGAGSQPSTWTRSTQSILGDSSPVLPGAVL
ncbi:Pleckstriny Domain-Containing Family G Member 4B [Manis pentadactyla]|nr:Pleckstriny Domain-Containing Family G Member 4B [Manis pentadactyla]